MPLFQNATFYISAHHLRDLPPPVGVEVAFAGRSNAGKSSALNTLANHNRLAYVSKQPGRTQLINFFSLGKDQFLVDLPGYGYAKVDRKVQAHWETLLSKYLQERSQLRGMVLIVDSRRGLTDLDRNMLAWFCPTGKPVHLLITKCDKLNLSEKSLVMKAVKDELKSLNINNASFGELSAQLFSSTKRLGLEQADELVCQWLIS